jgi:hypothetical protein
MEDTKHKLDTWLEKAKQIILLPCVVSIALKQFISIYAIIPWFIFPLKVNHVLYKELNFFQIATAAFQTKIISTRK